MKFIIDRKKFCIMDDKELLKLTPGELVDLGICPTCLNRKHNDALYGDNSDKLIYEDKDIECFFVGNPRADGLIVNKKNFIDKYENALLYINAELNVSDNLIDRLADKKLASNCKKWKQLNEEFKIIK